MNFNVKLTLIQVAMVGVAGEEIPELISCLFAHVTSCSATLWTHLCVHREGRYAVRAPMPIAREHARVLSIRSLRILSLTVRPTCTCINHTPNLS